MKTPVFCFFFLIPEGPSLLGLSHISVNASMTINDTAVTNVTISRLEAPDPIDSLDLTVCPADDILDGCKVSKIISLFMKSGLVLGNLLISVVKDQFLDFVSHVLLNVFQLYLCGLPGKKLEKLRRLVNAAGGLRFNQPSEELTHVVMGELDQDFNNFLSKATHRSECKDYLFFVSFPSPSSFSFFFVVLINPNLSQ